MTNNHLKLVGGSLTLRAPVAMWAEVLEGIDENYEDWPTPAGMALHEDFTFLSDSESDDVMRGQVTPEMPAGLDPAQRQLLANLENDVRKESDPLNSVRLMSRAATAFSLGVPLPLILNTIAGAAKKGSPYPFHSIYYFTQMNLIQFRDEAALNQKSATPEFNHDEYGAMAKYIHDRDLKALTARSESEFYYNDERISTHAVNSTIDFHLRNCNIWDSHRNVFVAVSNRLISEVRGAMARMWPRLSGQSPDGSDKFHRVTGPKYRERVAAFAEKQVCLDADAWTSSPILWEAWIAFCTARAEPSGASSTFFKELTRWSGGRIQRSKKGSHRVPGYSGIKMI
jgi:hypothetical protein